MSKKIGRPKIPKSKAKAILYGARVARDEAALIDKGIEASGQTPSGVIRKALDQVSRLDWVKTPQWMYHHLHDKWVQFRFKADLGGMERVVSGIGRFFVYQHGSDRSKLSIEIQIDAPAGQGVRQIRLSLSQTIADKIERHPQPQIADFRCFEIQP